MKTFYFDNAATSFPKPETVIKAMNEFFKKTGGNPGRSGHRKSIEAGRIVLKTRELLGELFNIKDPSKIILTKNCTEALNIAIFGTLKKGDHVVSTSMEHNSVLRPLKKLAGEGIEADIAEGESDGEVPPENIFRLVKPNTKLIIATHASNVTGTINDIAKIGSFCRENKILFLVDAAQTAGCVPIDAQKNNIDFLAFSGHKSLFGPQGTGGLYIKNEEFTSPFMYGGTGSLSDREDQPDFLPDRFESGTLNVIGFAGLGEGVKYILKKRIEKIVLHERKLLEIFLNELNGIKNIKIYGTSDLNKHTGVLSLNLENLSASEAGEVLDSRYGILTRIGLHCAPRAHKTTGTFPHGTVRFGMSFFTKESDVLSAVKALKELAL